MQLKSKFNYTTMNFDRTNKLSYYTLVLTLLLFYISNCYGQNNLSVVETQNLKIGQVSLSDSKNKVESEFGIPGSTTTEYWEIGDKTVVNYIYGDSKLTFYNDHLISFDINTSKFIFNYEEKSFKVSDSIHNLSEPFPDSYQQRDNGQILVIFGFRKNGELKKSDAFLQIGYNSSDKITYIREWSP